MPTQPGPGDSPPPPGRRPGGGPATPHDAVFRRIFGVPENMASQLRAVLPPGLTARLDLTRLAPVAASFVDEALRWRHSDLLFTAPLDGRDAYVYLLAEHQSSDDPLMAFRMLRYVTRIWDQHLRERPNARLLPAVIPLVVHHGPAPWASPVQVLDLIDLSPPPPRRCGPTCLGSSSSSTTCPAPTAGSCETGTSPRRRSSPCSCPRAPPATPPSRTCQRGTRQRAARPGRLTRPGR